MDEALWHFAGLVAALGAVILTIRELLKKS